LFLLDGLANTDSSTKSTGDDQEIRGTVEGFFTAWEQRDVEIMRLLWAGDFDPENFRGDFESWPYWWDIIAVKRQEQSAQAILVSAYLSVEFDGAVLARDLVRLRRGTTGWLVQEVLTEAETDLPPLGANSGQEARTQGGDEPEIRALGADASRAANTVADFFRNVGWREYDTAASMAILSKPAEAPRGVLQFLGLRPGTGVCQTSVTSCIRIADGVYRVRGDTTLYGDEDACLATYEAETVSHSGVCLVKCVKWVACWPYRPAPGWQDRLSIAPVAEVPHVSNAFPREGVIFVKTPEAQ
jgi:hypothetical protein